MKKARLISHYCIIAKIAAAAPNVKELYKSRMLSFKELSGLAKSPVKLKKSKKGKNEEE